MASSMKKYNGEDEKIIAKNYEAGFRVFGAGAITGVYLFIIIFIDYYTGVNRYTSINAIFDKLLGFFEVPSG